MKGEGIIGKRILPLEEYFYVVFRVLIGLVFLLHGASKTIFAKAAMPMLFTVVGCFEILAGILILLGLWTRLGAFIGSVIMIAAWIKVHGPSGLNPLANGGEAALLFFLAFLVILVHGSGKFGLEHWMHKKERI